MVAFVSTEMAEFFTYLALSNSFENGGFNLVGVLVQAHVSQHHDGAEEESSGVGESLASDIGSGAVNSLEDGALITNVAGGSETETTNETSAHIRKDISVQVGHDQDLVVVRSGIRDHLQASVVEQLSVELNVGVLLGKLAGSVEEKTIGHLHNGGLVHGADLLPSNLLGMLESKSKDALRCLAGDELDALDNTINNDVLDARVFTLSVLSDEDGIDAVVWGLEADDGLAGSQVGEKVEGSAEGEVEGDVALADRSL